MARYLGANWVQNAPKLHPVSLILFAKNIP